MKKRHERNADKSDKRSRRNSEGVNAEWQDESHHKDTPDGADKDEYAAQFLADRVLHHFSFSVTKSSMGGVRVSKTRSLVEASQNVVGSPIVVELVRAPEHAVSF